MLTDLKNDDTFIYLLFIYLLYIHISKKQFLPSFRH